MRGEAAPAADVDPAPPHAFAVRLDDELALRLVERHHAPALHARVAAQGAHLARAFGWARDASPESITARVAARLERFRRGDGWHADLCWYGEPVGGMWLRHLQRPGGSAEVGYWLARTAEKRGLATRAVRGLLRYCFDGRGLGRVAVAVDPRNEAAAAVAQRLGFRSEALLRRGHLAADGRPTDLAWYGLLREEWEAGGGERGGALPRFALRADDELDLGLLERADAPALGALVEANRAYLRPWMPWAADTSANATLAFIEQRALPAIETANGFEVGLWWRGRLVGSGGLHSVRATPLRGSLGYWLAEHAQGHGLATRAMRAVLDKAFADHGFERVDLRADVGNLASRGVAERLGLRFEGILRREYWNGSAYVDLAVYALVRSEWLAGDVAGGGGRRPG
jgi:ribosomal-protein-serine acetyltransferase